MHGSLLTAATIGLAALGASAAPAAPRRHHDAQPSTSGASTSNGSPFPFSDGFPTPSPQQLQQIEIAAHGTLSNSTPPANISAQGLVNLRLIDFAERIESVYFEELLYNVTNYVPGYELPSWVDYDYFVNFLNVTQHVEELHNLNAVNALAHFNQTAIQPCTRYNFPVSNLEEAITLAMTFTSNVFGVLGEVVQIFAQNGDVGLVRGVVQAVANEGEQNGFFRYLLGRVPDELPFTTVSNRDFAFTALQGFVDPTSCPNIDIISADLKTFEKVTFLDTPVAKTEDVRLSLSIDKYVNGTAYNVVYVNQLNNPVVVPATYVSCDSTSVIIKATFPFDEHLMNGLTIASVTDQAGPFANVDAVAQAAIWAPAFAVVN
ncbi:LsdA family protein [Calocera viscosa TUFC12733]|uniref:LsdA family protein n=1 Tax=Calocera viscosa (strain TUFC12733) TaxID=1330018 RepID=A0A167SDN0_CALVF|nr:LsdA family protein [Calocera viscosa TUFC12733]